MSKKSDGGEANLRLDTRGTHLVLELALVCPALGSLVQSIVPLYDRGIVLIAEELVGKEHVPHEKGVR